VISDAEVTAAAENAVLYKRPARFKMTMVLENYLSPNCTVRSSGGGHGSNVGPETGCPELFRNFPQSLQVNDGIVHLIRPRLILSAFFPVHCSLILPFDVFSLSCCSLVTLSSTLYSLVNEKAS
jgi:hypothetical protein